MNLSPHEFTKALDDEIKRAGGLDALLAQAKAAIAKEKEHEVLSVWRWVSVSFLQHQWLRLGHEKINELNRAANVLECAIDRREREIERGVA